MTGDKTRRTFGLPRWSHFAVAIVASACVALVRMVAAPYLANTAPFFLSTLAVSISGYVGGLWPGLVATFLTTMSGLFLFQGVSQFGNPQFHVILSAQIIIGSFVSVICGELRRSEQQAAKTAKQLTRSSERISAIFDSISDALVTVDRDLNLIGFNQRAADLWGLSEGDEGKALKDCTPELTYGALEVPIRRAIELSDAATIEYPDPKLGQTFEVRIFPSPEGVLVYFRDVTDRITHDDALARLAIEQEKTRALLDSLLANAPIGFAFFDSKFRYERINEDLASINGMSAFDHIGKSIREVIPGNADELEQIVGSVFQTGKPVSGVEIESEADGVPRYWLCSYYPVLDRDHKIKSVGAVVLDITERKEMENRLREGEERFSSMADNAPVMIWLCNRDTSAIWFNKPWLEFRKLDLEHAIEEGCFANLHPDDENRVRETFGLALLRNEKFSVEYRTQDGEGNFRWLNAHGNPLYFDNGQVENFIVSCVDVTDRKDSEQSIRRLLSNERAARSEAERANRVKDEFVATLSHELRTPLTTMLGWTELLRSGMASPSDQADGLEAIERSTRLQMQLINDLLDMSRISTGKIRLELEFAELGDITSAAVDMVRPSAANKGVDLHFDMPEDPLLVHVDPNRMTQILWNLLTNAIKFTPKGGEVRVEVEGVGKSNAVIRVTDNGEGIESDFLENVFDRFRQADGTVSRRHGGLGLGLSIARQLAELHGGTIEALSDGPGKGSQFIVKIPTTEMSQGQVLAATTIEHDAIMSNEPLKEVKILLVEDDEASRELLNRILQGAGAEVFAADSAVMARQLLREHKPDVMISDIGMPDEDGYRLIRSIRTLPVHEQGLIPAAALTAFARNDDRDKAMEAGFNLHLVKPIESSDLVTAVLSMLKMRPETVNTK